MLIGIDMLGAQSLDGGDREAGRYGRQLVAALLAHDPSRRFVLYTHEGLPVDRVPTARNAHRVSMAPASVSGPSRIRMTTQRLLDQNPDGLDWLILLDPFEPGYGGMPPESPLNGVKVASIVHDLAPALADDRRLAPLRRHDAVLAVSEATAADCRKRLGTAGWRVATIGVGCDETFAAPGVSEPMTRVSGDELGRLGVHGPFLFASLVGSPARGNLLGILDTYHRLPFEHRRRHSLVIAGPVEDPESVRDYLYDRGCDEGLVLAGEVSEASLRTLYGRCSAFLSPSFGEGSGQSLIEAMKSGAVVFAGIGGAQAAIVGDGGFLVDPTNPVAIADEVARLLADADLDRETRKKALAQASRFGWTAVVDAITAAFAGGIVEPGRKRIRVDGGHTSRSRVAVFPDFPLGLLGRVDLAAQVPSEWRSAYNVDLYLDAGFSTLADGLPSEFGGFDARLFDRNDSLLGYHAVAYRIGESCDLDAMIARIARRPGLVFLLDDALLDRVEMEPVESLDPTPTKPRPRDFRSDQAIAQLRDLFATGSRVVVASPHHLDRLRSAFPDHAEQVVEIPPAVAGDSGSDLRRTKARARLDLTPGTVVVGQFGEPVPSIASVLKAVPNLVLLAFDTGLDEIRARKEAARLGVSDRYLFVGPVSPAEAKDVVAMLDLAVHSGSPATVSILDLLRGGVPTIGAGSGSPAQVVRDVVPTPQGDELADAVRDLATDEAARSVLGRSARDYLFGVPDPARSAAMLVSEVERCASELPRAPGRRHRRPGEVARGLTLSPHFSRPASSADEAATRSR